MAKGNSIDTEDSSVNDQGFKKTETTITPSANKEPIEDVNAKLMHEAPVHGSNVLDQSHEQQNGQAHDQKHKFNK
ncbi:hypothetical protein NliqN6_6334 [Naganishia liquefaciens]|uniref:Uncharacterized protein n=1 Tax=Naganishia liquefaciens TaxID=104408 RepID=A0A8H3TZD6_9TREE|nr:hypothetical protein NliqN6_6334 [Naganishia liquefaciens]